MSSARFAGKVANCACEMWHGESDRISSGPAFGMDSPNGKNGESGLYADVRRMIGQITITSHRIAHFRRAWTDSSEAKQLITTPETCNRLGPIIGAYQAAHHRRVI